MNEKILLFIILFGGFVMLAVNSVSAIEYELKLQDAGTENIADSYVMLTESGTNFGTENYLHTYNDGGDNDHNSYFMFDITSIPVGATITGANLSLYIFYSDTLAFDNVYEVNSTWNETIITWNNQPCGIGRPISDATKCNITAEDSVEISSGAINVWNNWSVTSMVKHAYGEDRDNVSMILERNSTNFATHKWWSKENTTESGKWAPILYIFYDVVDTTPPRVNITLNDTSLSQNDGVNVTGNVSDETGLSFCKFVINQTGKNQYWNESITGTSASCSQNFTIANAADVINFTIIVNDTFNNLNQSSMILTVGDVTIPTLHGFNFSLTTITDGDTLNLTINVSDTESYIDVIRFNVSDPNTKNHSRYNPTFFSITSNTKNYILNYTLFSGQETSVVGKWNLTYIYLKDNAENVLEFYPNQTTFEVTAVTGPGPSAPSGGGGGGITIYEITNVSLLLNPRLISTNFLYFPFKNINQTFSIEVNANKELFECSSKIFSCEILDDDVSLVVSKEVDDDTKFMYSFEEEIKVISQDGEAKTLPTKLTVINLGHYIKLDAPLLPLLNNQYLFKIQDDRIKGIRTWVVLLLIGISLYFVRKAMK